MTTISPLQRDIVQRSFRKIARRSDFTANLLYQRLFEIDPTCKMLFACDMRQQGRKLLQMFAIAIRGLDSPQTLIPELQKLGVRHVQYGAKRRDFELLGEALLFALQHTLDEDFTPEVSEAWAVTYQFMMDYITP